MKYTVYNSSGEILELLSITNANMVDIILQDRSYVEGHYDPVAYYINQGRPCAKAPQPIHEYIKYVFDWNNKLWTVDVDQTVQYAKQKRNDLLSAVDRVNPVWYAALTTQQQTQLQQYRQALLDVPQQTGFPTEVDWPAKPTWL